MLFYEPLFLFLSFPAFFTIYALFGSRHNVRLALLLAGSVGFYFWGEPRFVPVVVASSLLDYWIGGRLGRDPDSPGGRALLALGVVANLGVLVVYKYLMFLVTSADGLLGRLDLPGIAIPQIALPIGVSFIVFEKITYLVDVSRRHSPPAQSLTQYLTYVFFFPKLLAGPIIKYHEIEGQFRRTHHLRWDEMASGMLRFMQGLVKKTLLADTLGSRADLIFALPLEQVGFANAWLGVGFFTLQIYFDFSAYSDMAIGLARILGFELRENFNMPYISRSITEFWRRWHISLSTWIKEYLYIPLGGSRVGPARRYVNLWLCFLISGLWHGAAWTYIAWGAYNGLFLVLDKLLLLRILNRLPPAVATMFTLLIVMAGWTIFRATSNAQLGAFLAAMLQPGRPGAALEWPPNVVATGIVGAVLCAAPMLPRFRVMARSVLGSSGARFAMEMALAAVFVVAVSMATADPFKPFLYFRF